MTDDEMRTLLEDAVADVHPRHALADIRRRTARPRRRSWAWTAGGAAVATAATVAAVVALTHAPPRSSPDPASPPARSGPTVLTYFAADAGPGLRLFPERQRTSSSSTALADAVRDVVLGSTTVPDHRTLWPGGTSVRSVERHGDEVVVDLSGSSVALPGRSRAASRLALQQVVYTVDQVAGARLPVRFLVDGGASSTVLGEPADRPVAPGAVDATVSPVYVLSPTQDSSVARTFTVTGRASAFEGTVQWELRKRDGTTRIGYTTTKECCRLSPYSFSVTATPGDYTLTVHDEDVSDGEGTPATRETRTLTVR